MTDNDANVNKQTKYDEQTPGVAEKNQEWTKQKKSQEWMMPRKKTGVDGQTPEDKTESYEVDTHHLQPHHWR